MSQILDLAVLLIGLGYLVYHVVKYNFTKYNADPESVHSAYFNIARNKRRG